MGWGSEQFDKNHLFSSEVFFERGAVEMMDVVCAIYRRAGVTVPLLPAPFLEGKARGNCLCFVDGSYTPNSKRAQFMDARAS